MKWTIHQLQQYQNREFTFDETLDMMELTEIDPTIRDVSPIRVTGRADISSTKITFHLNISGTLILPCSRTLVDVPFKFDRSAMETFLLKGIEYATEEGEEEIHAVHGDVIDLIPIITEHIMLEIPMQVFSEDDTPKGGAPQSGKDWEVLKEDEQKEKIDPRLAGLAKFFEKDSKA